MAVAARAQLLLFPLPDREMARRQRQQRAYKATLPDEFERFLAEAPNDDYRDLFTLMRWSGLRVSEATSIRWENVDFAVPQLRKVFGKGSVFRDVDLLPEAEVMLLRRRALGEPASGYVFPGHAANGCISPRAVQRVMQKMRAKLAVPPERGTPHKFRHLYATDGLEKGASLQVVSDQLGHANISTTATYLHSRPGQMRRVYEGR